MNANDFDKKCKFSLPDSIKLIIKHGGKIFFVIVLFIITVALIGGRAYLNLIVVHLILLLSLTFIVDRILRNFICDLTLDFFSRKIQFTLCRSEEIIYITFDEIKKIKINAYVTFTLNGRKLFYNGELTNNFLSCLSKVKVISWGILSKRGLN